MPLYEVTIKKNNKTILVLQNVSRIDYDLMPVDGICGSINQFVPCYRITLAGTIDIKTNADSPSMIDYEYHNPIVLWFAYWVDLEVVKISF